MVAEMPVKTTARTGEEKESNKRQRGNVSTLLKVLFFLSFSVITFVFLCFFFSPF